MSFGIVLADLGVVEGDDDLFETIFLVERLVLDLFFCCCCGCLSWFVLCIFWWLSSLCLMVLLLFLGFFAELLKLHALFRHFLKLQ